jgi:hypothetical protein
MPPAQQQQPQQQEEQQQQQQVPPSPLATDSDSSDDDSNASWAASVTSSADLSTITSNADRPFSTQSLASIDEEFQTTEQRQCIKALREGKRYWAPTSGLHSTCCNMWCFLPLVTCVPLLPTYTIMILALRWASLCKHRLLKEQSGAPAMIHFEKALMLAKFLGNKVSERRAVRGLAAASRLQVPTVQTDRGELW